jgi:4-amino-4-deoxy-L-arabinose transferase-like glycosyltransferase
VTASTVPPPAVETVSAPPRLRFSSLLILLAFGAAVLLIDLGSGRVLTRHEVLAAQPAREMLWHGDWRHYILPTFAGVYRTAKPPGMMWLIAGSLALFHTEAEWAARLPSALSGLAVALMIATLAGRWLGNRTGLICGCVQITSWYILMQAKLAEQDMAMAACVCGAMCLLAVHAIDSPSGRISFWPASTLFYALAAGSFILKGPIGLMFIFSSTIAFGVAAMLIDSGKNGPENRESADSERIEPAGEKPTSIRSSSTDSAAGADTLPPARRRLSPLARRVFVFLVNPLGIAILLLFVVGWPLAARHIYPGITRDWNSEAIGTATGKWGDDPDYFYLYSIPAMLLPWTPFTILGLFVAWNSHRLRPPGDSSPALLSSLLESARHNPLAVFLACWFLPGFLLLSLCIANKHNHYSIPILPALTITTALGLDAYVRFTQGNKNPRPLLAAGIFLGGCAIAIVATVTIRQIPRAMVFPTAAIIGVVAAGGLAAIEAERRRWPDAQLAAYFLTVGAVAIAVQVGIMPAQDDYRPQADLARQANALVPAGAEIFLLGNREEEHEASFAYYLRPPIQRVDDFDVFKKTHPPGVCYATICSGLVGDLSTLGHVEVLARCSALRPHETEDNRVLLVRVAMKQ